MLCFHCFSLVCHWKLRENQKRVVGIEWDTLPSGLSDDITLLDEKISSLP
jgi:hypothetical protein